MITTALGSKIKKQKTKKHRAIQITALIMSSSVDIPILPIVISIGSGLFAYLCYSHASQQRELGRDFDATPMFTSVKQMTESLPPNAAMAAQKVKFYATVQSSSSNNTQPPLTVQDEDERNYSAAILRLRGNQVVFTKVYKEQKREEVSDGANRHHQTHKKVVETSTTKSKDVELSKSVRPQYDYLVHSQSLHLSDTSAASSGAPSIMSKLLKSSSPMISPVIYIANAKQLLDHHIQWKRIADVTKREDPRLNEHRVLKQVKNAGSENQDICVHTLRERVSSRYDIEETSGDTKAIYYTLYKDILPIGCSVFVWGNVGFDVSRQAFTLQKVFEFSNFMTEEDVRHSITESVWWSNFGAAVFGLIGVGAAGFGIYRYMQRKNRK